MKIGFTERDLPSAVVPRPGPAKRRVRPAKRQPCQMRSPSGGPEAILIGHSVLSWRMSYRGSDLLITPPKSRSEGRPDVLRRGSRCPPTPFWPA